MPYTISFSDPTKSSTITVPDMPPGINTVDTSLGLVGRGYPNYGQKIAENFVHLLENFSGPIPPQNPIEGQLWYDTSDPNNKVLRIMDGTAEATRWPSANGIYQQGTDPRDSATQGLKIGDIWVDTASNQLKIFNSNDWTTVGPSIAGPEPTGSVSAKILDTVNILRDVIYHMVSGRIIAITAKDQFTPKAVIEGFTILRPGINISSAVVENQPAPLLNGTAVRSQNLVDVEGNSFSTDLFLRKNDQSQYGQIIDGLVRFRTPSATNTLSGQGRDGIVINNVSSISDTRYVQFYKGDNDAILLNNTDSGKIVFKVKGATLTSIAELSNNRIDLLGNTNVSGALSITDSLVLSSTGTTVAIISGGMTVGKNLSVAENLSVQGQTTVTGLLSVGSDIVPLSAGTQNLGSLSRRFRQVYADIIGSTGSVFVGSFNGLATGLQQSTEFRIRGQITGTSVLYNGTSTTATFVTQLTPEAITSQTSIASTTSNLNLLVVDTGTNSLHKIDRNNFLSNIFPTGMITAYGTNTNIPSGWLLCDGAAYTSTNYVELFTLIGTTYGSSGAGTFRVPDMRSSTTATDLVTYISYIIKT